MRPLCLSMLALVLLAACGPSAPAGPATPLEPPPSITPAPSPTLTTLPGSTATRAPNATPISFTTPEPPPLIGPESYPPDVNPLTGLALDDPSLLASRRPLVVKISNAPPVVRPQSGLSYADMVIEHYAEGGWTRFSAIFWGQGVDHLGSVRSVRLLDIQLTEAFDALLVFSGGSNGVIDTIRLEPIYPYNTISPQFGLAEPYFVRFPRPGLPYEHTLFTDTAELWAWAESQQVRTETRLGLPGMAFSPLPPDGGAGAAYAGLSYSRTEAEWRYDPISGVYHRWTDGIPHLDALTGEQLGFENVIVLSAYHEEVVLFPEKYFGEETSLYIELVGEGPLTLLRDGLAYGGRWVRATGGSTFSYVDLNGSPLPLKPGQTFIQIIRVGFEELVIRP